MSRRPVSPEELELQTRIERLRTTRRRFRVSAAGWGLYAALMVAAWPSGLSDVRMHRFACAGALGFVLGVAMFARHVRMYRDAVREFQACERELQRTS